MHPTQKPKRSYIAEQLADRSAPVIVATDYMKNYGEQMRSYIDSPMTVLGTDGFGRSDSRAALRHFFEVDRYFIAVAALKALADQGEIKATVVAEAIEAFGIDPEKANPLYL